MFSEQVKRKVREAYEKNMASYPKKKEEVEAFIRTVSSEEQLCMQFLYGFMTVNDIVSYEAEYLAQYVQASLEMRRHVPYAEGVPEELFLTYVLQYRVNNESIDGSRRMLYETLLPRVEGKGMAQAALEVNYWCYENATYMPSDDRTLSPSAMMKKAKGRCGEESTFTVCAMRSVGIPARQCYAPRWAHCDDNHAWVEVWVDGDWHYLGACEPEPVLDKGWFTAAASKAMLVHSKAYSNLITGDEAAYETPVYTLINSTATYGRAKRLWVQVLEHGIPQKDVMVQFQLVNYSELYTIYEAHTDAEGKVSFLTGMGDICIYVEKDGRSLFRKADVRLEREVVLDLKDALHAWQRDGWIEDFDMAPPAEQVAAVPRKADWKLHEKRLAVCDARREAVEAGFPEESQEDPFSHYRMLAKGNQKEVEAFLSWEGAQDEEKREILSTLREKDLVDITCEALKDAVLCARPYRDSYPRDCFIAYVLAPRIHNEMIRPVRRDIAEVFRQRGITFSDGRQVWEYLKQQVRIMPDYGAAIETADSFGALFYGMCDAASFPVVYVAVCRSLGIAARLHPVTKKPEYGVIKKKAVTFLSPVTQEENPLNDREKSGQTKRVSLTRKGEASAVYSLSFTLGVWKPGGYQTLDLSGLAVRGEITLDLEPGQYRLLTSVRQIDGSVSARLHCFTLDRDRRMPLVMREDRTKEKLKSIPLHAITVKGEKTARPLSEVWKDYPGLLIVADPGKEPTEHLFQEILECREAYRDKGIGMAILLKDPSRNETLRKVREALPKAKVLEWQDAEEIYQLHVDMQVGDERLPFVVALNREGQGLFAFANYNIRTAQTMLHILEVSE